MGLPCQALAVLGSGHVWSWVCTCDYVSMSSLFGWTLLGDWGSWVALCHLLWNWHPGGQLSHWSLVPGT